MAKGRFSIRATISLLLIKDKEILLIRRFNTGWEDGRYSLMGGHLEEDETLAETTIREAKEEIGITLDPENLKVVNTMHTSTNKRNYIDFFLVATKWKGKPVIKEKDKMDDIRWFPLNDLPGNMPQLIRNGIDNYIRNETFSEYKHTLKVQTLSKKNIALSE